MGSVGEGGAARLEFLGEEAGAVLAGPLGALRYHPAVRLDEGRRASTRSASAPG